MSEYKWQPLQAVIILEMMPEKIKLLVHILNPGFMKALVLLAGLFLLEITARSQPTFWDLRRISNGCGDQTCFSKYAGEQKFLFEKQAFAKGTSIPSYIYKSADAVDIGNAKVYSYLVYASVKNPGLLSISLGYRTPDLKVINGILDDMKADGYTTTSTAMPLIYTKNNYKEKIHFFTEARSINGTTYLDYTILFIVAFELRDESTQYYGDLYLGESVFTGLFYKNFRKLGIQKFNNGNVFKGGATYGVMEYADKKRFYGALSNDDSPTEGIIKKQNGDMYYLYSQSPGGTASRGSYWSSSGDFFFGYITYDGQKVSGMQQKANGEMYDGQFKDSLYDGTGTLYYPDGKMVLAVFRKGTPVGKGVIYYSEGISEIKQFTPAPEAISASDTFNVKYRYFKNSKGQRFWGQARYNYSLNAWVPNGCGVLKRHENWDAVFTWCYIDNTNPDYYLNGGTIFKDAQGNIGFFPNTGLVIYNNNSLEYNIVEALFLKLKSGDIYFNSGSIRLYNNGNIFVGSPYGKYSPFGTFIMKNGRMYDGYFFNSQQSKAIDVDLIKKEAYEGGFIGTRRDGGGYLYKPGLPPKVVIYRLGVLVK